MLSLILHYIWHAGNMSKTIELLTVVHFIDQSSVTTGSRNASLDKSVQSRKSRYWKFFSSADPSLYDAFARDVTLWVVFQSKAGYCSRCVRNGPVMRLDYGGVAKEPSWSCVFGQERVVAKAIVDPHGHVFVITCDIPPSQAAQRVSILAEAEGEVPLVYGDVEYHYTAKRQLFLAGCTMIRPSLVATQLLLEWLAYHRLQGFEHFMIYTDGDPSPLLKSLRVYVEEGIVDVVDWEWPTYGFQHQQAQMHSCLYHYRGIARWVAFFDMDEYFQPMADNTTVKQVLMSRGETAAGLTAQMVCFDPTYNHGLITQHSQARSSTPLPPGERSKCIVCPEQVATMGVHMITSGGYAAVADPFVELRLNHYRSGLEMATSTTDSSMTKYGPDLEIEMKRIESGPLKRDMSRDIKF